MQTYLWLKAFHLIGIVAWFAGIFYMPRLFVYHHGATDRISTERFGVMERKLYRIIMNPAAAVAVTFGLALMAVTWSQHGHSGWLYAKLILVAVLIAFHVYCGALMRRFAAGERPHTERFLRMFNELPALLLILIVLLAVLKPF